MGVRIVFEFLEDAESDQWSRVFGVLEEAGAEDVSAPVGESPHLLTAVLPDDADLDAALERLRGVGGVGRADADAPRETFEPM